MELALRRTFSPTRTAIKQAKLLSQGHSYTVLPRLSVPQLSVPRLSVPRLSETSVIRTQFRTWCLFKKYGILTKIAGSATELSTCVCVSYIHGQCRHTVLMVRPAYSVKCKGLQTRPSYILLCYNSMYIAGKVSFGLSEQFRLSEQPIKPLCPKVFG